MSLTLPYFAERGPRTFSRSCLTDGTWFVFRRASCTGLFYELVFVLTGVGGNVRGVRKRLGSLRPKAATLVVASRPAVGVSLSTRKRRWAFALSGGVAVPASRTEIRYQKAFKYKSSRGRF